jgi:anoctamin-4
MIDTISDVSQSFESGFSVNLNNINNTINNKNNAINDRRSSVNGSFDESWNSKIVLLQKFTELESMHPNVLEKKIAYKRNKTFKNTDTIKEVSPDSGQGDDLSFHNEYDIDDEMDSAARRPSKQDAELREDPDTLYFRDGRRKIDMILCFEEEFDGAMTEEQAIQREKRRVFHDSLIKEGLDLEIEDKSQAFDEKTYFVKIHLPWRTESRYAEVMNLKLPVKRFITISVKQDNDEHEFWSRYKFISKFSAFIKKYWSYVKVITEYDYNLIEKEPSFYSATNNGKREEQFIVKDRMTNYTGAQRSGIVFQILLRAKFDDGEKNGIRRLLNDGTYIACFPLHEGRYDKPHDSGIMLDRRVSDFYYFKIFHCVTLILIHFAAAVPRVGSSV